MQVRNCKRIHATIVPQETRVTGAMVNMPGVAGAGVTYFSDVTKELGEKIIIIRISESFNG